MLECKCSPLFKKGGKGGFYTAAHSYQSEHIYDISYKSPVFPLLDEIDGLAERIGAVNTIVNDNGRMIGYNTDAVGVVRPWRRRSISHLRVAS